MPDDPRSGPKVGVLVPFTNTNLEPDMHMMRPNGVTFHFQRLGGYDVDEVPGSDQMAGLGAWDISDSLRMVAGVRPAAVLYGCTSATLTHGTSFDRDLAGRISKVSGAVSITAAGALVEAIRALGARRIGFSSPYLGEINVQAVAFLADEGIETAQRADIGRTLGNYGQGELTADEIIALAERADGGDVEAIVLSCTDMRAAEVVGRIEDRLGKPVVTSNQAMIFGLCKQLGLGPPKGAQGQLLDCLGQ